ncbi:MAG: hypothetical protein JO336_24025 [Acidobacteriia bacterium]|nr:hypothetical protein [Terriglobia bacterium]
MDSGEFRSANVKSALDLLGCFDQVFDVLRPTVVGTAPEIGDSDIEDRIAQRTAAKKARNFALADQIRTELLERGILLEDTKAGVRWKRKSN